MTFVVLLRSNANLKPWNLQQMNLSKQDLNSNGLAIEVYRFEPRPANRDQFRAGGEIVTVQIPRSWQKQKTSPLTQAAFQVQSKEQSAKITITRLPDARAKMAANVNRWNGQLGLPQESVEDVEAALERSKLGQYYSVHIENDNTRIKAYILHRNGFSWFFKMMGSKQLVEENGDAFLKCLQSVTFKKAGQADE